MEVETGMPRTGDVYSAPAGTTAVPNTTIESAKYNALVADLVADLNLARPITAGGTGATNAADAKTNLGIVDAAVSTPPHSSLINGSFLFWQRATSQTASGYGSDDRWANLRNGTTVTTSRQTHTLGQTDVPGNPKYYSQSVVSSVTGSTNYASKCQRIEGVQTHQGETITCTLYAKANATRNIYIEFQQNFGTGGSPSSSVYTAVGLKALGTGWTKHTFTVAIPSIAGKTLGTSGGDNLAINIFFDAGSSTRAAALGHQSGTFDISEVSVVSGDLTSITIPYSPRTIAQEQMMCERYCETIDKYGAVYDHTNAFSNQARAYVLFRTKKYAVPGGLPTVVATHVSGGSNPGPSGTITVAQDGFMEARTISITGGGPMWFSSAIVDAEIP